MCNLYSITKSQQATGDPVKVLRDLTEALFWLGVDMQY